MRPVIAVKYAGSGVISEFAGPANMPVVDVILTAKDSHTMLVRERFSNSLAKVGVAPLEFLRIFVLEAHAIFRAPVQGDAIMAVRQVLYYRGEHR